MSVRLEAALKRLRDAIDFADPHLIKVEEVRDQLWDAYTELDSALAAESDE